MAGEDPAHLRHLRGMPCAVDPSHPAPSDAHHATGIGVRGMSQRSHDHLAIPLCHTCHMDFHAARGFFRGMKKAERKAWQVTMSERYMPKCDPDVF